MYSGNHVLHLGYTPFCKLLDNSLLDRKLNATDIEFTVYYHWREKSPFSSTIVGFLSLFIVGLLYFIYVSFNLYISFVTDYGNIIYQTEHKKAKYRSD